MKREYVVLLGVGIVAMLLCQKVLADDFSSSTMQVGLHGDTLATPVNQLATPAGTQLDLPTMRPQALALSPDAQLLVTSGMTNELVVVDPATGKIRQHVPLPIDRATPAAPLVPGNPFDR